MDTETLKILFIKSDLRLVVDLQNCIKAQKNQTYAQKVKISNLQQMAKTVAYIEEHHFDTRADLQNEYEDITMQLSQARHTVKTLKLTCMTSMNRFTTPVSTFPANPSLHKC